MDNREIFLRVNCRRATFLLFLTAFFGLNINGYSQPTWAPAPAASNADGVIYTGTGGTATVECINVDMYTDRSANNMGSWANIVVWDELVGGNWNVYFTIWDGTLAAPVLSRQVVNTNDARHPDVAFGDIATANPGDLTFAIIYETPGGDIEMKEYDVTGFWGFGTPSVTPRAGALYSCDATISNATEWPHIDARPVWQNSTYYGGGNLYEPLRQYAITWSENNSGWEVYLDYAQINGGGPTGTPFLSGSGRYSDIAAVQWDNGSTRNGYAHLVYIDGSGDLVYDKFDLTTPGFSGISILENTLPIVPLPRIDAMNVDDPGTTNTKWMAIAEVDNTGGTGQYEIRTYDNVNGTTDFGSGQPFTSPGANGFKPAICAGPGPSDYNTATTSVGYTNYLLGFRFDIQEVTAANYDGTVVNTFGAYKDVNNTAIDVSIPQPPSAYTTSSNCGRGHFVAWYNYDATPGTGYQIGYKLNLGASPFTYKPASIVHVEERDFIAFPNPAVSYVTVNGINANTMYTATDITGRVVLRGNISPSDTRIDIANIAQGIYMFKFDENGTINHLKLVKQ